MRRFSCFVAVFCATILIGSFSTNTLVAASSAPTVTRVVPSIGLANGGSHVWILGSQFINVTAVNFGTTPAPSFTVISSMLIRAVVPAGDPSSLVDVTVISDDGTSTIVPMSSFFYHR